MFMETNRHVAGAYWHWYFLSQPEPFPERLIGSDPDFFYETCLVGWGATKLADFDPELVAEYRRCWRKPDMIHGSCSDYRAAASIDLEHDAADIDKKVACPTLALWGGNGVMHKFSTSAMPGASAAKTSPPRACPAGTFLSINSRPRRRNILAKFLQR